MTSRVSTSSAGIEVRSDNGVAHLVPRRRAQSLAVIVSVEDVEQGVATLRDIARRSAEPATKLIKPMLKLLRLSLQFPIE